MLILYGIQIQPNLLMGMCQKVKVAQNTPKHIFILELMKSDEILEICEEAHGSKQLSDHAGCQEVSRCCTGGESEELIVQR